MTRVPLLVAFALVCLAIGCGGPTEPEDVGRLDVYVRDTAGEPVNGVVLRLERPDGHFEAGGVTGAAGSSGYFFFLHAAGDYRLRLNLPNGYELGPNQSGTVDVSFSGSQIRTVNIVLRKL